MKSRSPAAVPPPCAAGPTRCQYAIVLSSRAAGSTFIQTPQISRCIVLPGVNLVVSALPVRVGKDRRISNDTALGTLALAMSESLLKRAENYLKYSRENHGKTTENEG